MFRWLALRRPDQWCAANMDAMELSLHRANTLAFIGANPTQVVLIPLTDRTRTSGGGWTTSDAAPREPQKFRIIELGSRSSVPIVRGQDGKERKVTFWLLGLHDSAMEIGDHWEADDNREWEVGDIIIDNHYERRGLVVERGRG